METLFKIFGSIIDLFMMMIDIIFSLFGGRGSKK